jgi:hypothetical protein
MDACEICSGRHLTSCCVIAKDFVDQCFAPARIAAPVPLQPPTDVTELFEFRRRRNDAQRAAWESERAQRRRAAALERTHRYRQRQRSA